MFYYKDNEINQKIQINTKEAIKHNKLFSRNGKMSLNTFRSIF